MEPDTGFGLTFDNAIALFPCLDPGLFSGIGLFEEPSLLADDLFKVFVIIIAVELIEATPADHSDLVVCSRHSDAMVALCFLSVPSEGLLPLDETKTQAGACLAEDREVLYFEFDFADMRHGYLILRTVFVPSVTSGELARLALVVAHC